MNPSKTQLNPPQDTYEMLILTELEAFRGFLTFRNDPLGKELGVQGWFPSGLGFDICYCD